MKIENRISAFEKLGDFLNGFTSSNNDNTHILEKPYNRLFIKMDGLHQKILEILYLPFRII